MASKKFIVSGMASLKPTAREECERLWDMRDQLPCLTEVTFPILVQYCGAWDKARELSTQLADLHGEQLEDAINNLAKLQKIMLAYANVLKLNEKAVEKSKNKFYDLLVESGK